MVGVEGFDLQFHSFGNEIYGVNFVEPGSSDSPPDYPIRVGSNPY